MCATFWLHALKNCTDKAKEKGPRPLPKPLCMSTTGQVGVRGEPATWQGLTQARQAGCQGSHQVQRVTHTGECTVES